MTRRDPSIPCRNRPVKTVAGWSWVADITEAIDGRAARCAPMFPVLYRFLPKTSTGFLHFFCICTSPAQIALLAGYFVNDIGITTKLAKRSAKRAVQQRNRTAAEKPVKSARANGRIRLRPPSRIDSATSRGAPGCLPPAGRGALVQAPGSSAICRSGRLSQVRRPAGREQFPRDARPCTGPKGWRRGTR